MDRKLFIESIKKIGMKVSKTGIVSCRDTGYTYGVAGHDAFITLDKEEHPYENISEMEFIEVENDFKIIYANGERHKVEGSILDDGDEDSIGNKPMPRTLAELKPVFALLYPNAKNQLYFDELAEKVMVNLSMFGINDKGVRPMIDEIISVYHLDLEEKLLANGYGGKPPAFAIMDEMIDIQTFNNARNPFREWVESHKWDGKPRVRTWFQRLFGATAPPLREKGLEDRYIGDVAEAWFIGAIKRMYSETKHEIVPVFISRDQGIGKGTALRYTAGRDQWFKDTTADVSNIKEFLDSIRGHVIVELGESKQIRSGDVDLLKSFISMTSDQFRAPYGHYDKERPRHFILAATSNLDNVFIDITGNRRFYPLYCNSEVATYNPNEDDDGGVYEVEQLWAEALQLYKDGHFWYMDEESADIAAIMQEYSTQENGNVDTINNWLDDPSHLDENGRPYTELGAKVDKRTILMNVYGWIEGTAIPKDIETSYRAWANGQTSWEKTSKTMRVNGKPSRGYVRVVPPGESKKVVRLPIARSMRNLKAMESDPVHIMRNRAKTYGFRDFGDKFPVDGLSQETVDMLLLEGYIYEENIGDYRLAILP